LINLHSAIEIESESALTKHWDFCGVTLCRDIM